MSLSFELPLHIYWTFCRKKTYVQPRFTADRIAFVNLGSIGKAAIFLPVSVNFVMVNSASLISIAPRTVENIVLFIHHIFFKFQEIGII